MGRIVLTGNGFNRENVVEPSEDMRKIVRQPSEDMWNIVRQFQQDVEDVLENEARRRSVEEAGMRCDIFGNDDLR